MKTSLLTKVLLGLLFTAILAASCTSPSSQRQIDAQTKVAVTSQLWVAHCSQEVVIDSIHKSQVVVDHYIYAKDSYDADRVLNDSIIKGKPIYTDYVIVEVKAINMPFKYQKELPPLKKE